MQHREMISEVSCFRLSHPGMFSSKAKEMDPDVSAFRCKAAAAPHGLHAS